MVDSSRAWCQQHIVNLGHYLGLRVDKSAGLHITSYHSKLSMPTYIDKRLEAPSEAKCNSSVLVFDFSTKTSVKMDKKTNSLFLTDINLNVI